jgi:hypothetical protein
MPEIAHLRRELTRDLRAPDERRKVKIYGDVGVCFEDAPPGQADRADNGDIDAAAANGEWLSIVLLRASIIVMSC